MSESSRASGYSRLGPALWSVVLFAAFLYVGSYIALSRRSVRELADWEGLLYITYSEAEATQDLTLHHRLAFLYAPINYIDRELMAAAARSYASCGRWMAMT